MTIPVFYIGSDGLSDVMSVSMVSLLVNTKFKIAMHVLDCGLGRFSKQVISDMCMSYESCESVYFISIDVENEFADYPKYNGYLDTWARILIPRLCPEFNKAIYIDGDTVVAGDINELWNEKLDSMAIGAVLDYYAVDHGEIYIDKDNRYFSCGVLLMDTEKLREMDLENLVRGIDAKHRFILAEQDALNIIFGHNNFKTLPNRYNIIDTSIFKRNAIYKEICDKPNFIPEDIIIAHYAARKPWRGQQAKETTSCELWWRYAAMSPYFESLWAKNCIASREVYDG